MPWSREDEAKEAAADGRDARRSGLADTANPHRPGTLGYNAWNEGWEGMDAYVIRLEKGEAA
jgi:hypothetical protein